MGSLIDLGLLGPVFIKHLRLTKSYKESLDLSSGESFLIFLKARVYAKRVALAISELLKRRKRFIILTKNRSLDN